MNAIKFTILILIVFASLFVQADSIFAVFFERGGATLSFQPANGGFEVNKIFSVAVLVDSPGEAMNASEARIVFPPDKLEALSISKENSIFSLWVEDPMFSNKNGAITFAGVLPNPGFIGMRGKIINITFKAKKVGRAELAITNARVLANDGLGTDMLRESKDASYIFTAQNLGNIKSGSGNDPMVGLADFSTLVGNWGKANGVGARFDLNKDGIVGVMDIIILFSRLW